MFICFFHVSISFSVLFLLPFIPSSAHIRRSHLFTHHKPISTAKIIFIILYTRLLSHIAHAFAWYCLCLSIALSKHSNYAIPFLPSFGSRMSQATHVSVFLFLFLFLAQSPAAASLYYYYCFDFSFISFVVVDHCVFFSSFSFHLNCASFGLWFVAHTSERRHNNNNNNYNHFRFTWIWF